MTIIAKIAKEIRENRFEVMLAAAATIILVIVIAAPALFTQMSFAGFAVWMMVAIPATIAVLMTMGGE